MKTDKYVQQVIGVKVNIKSLKSLYRNHETMNN